MAVMAAHCQQEVLLMLVVGAVAFVPPHTTGPLTFGRPGSVTIVSTCWKEIMSTVCWQSWSQTSWGNVLPWGDCFTLSHTELLLPTPVSPTGTPTNSSILNITRAQGQDLCLWDICNLHWYSIHRRCVCCKLTTKHYNVKHIIKKTIFFFFYKNNFKLQPKGLH